ncbi:MAG: M23 family metallopeptidase [Calditrichia bacterium]
MKNLFTVIVLFFILQIAVFAQEKIGFGFLSPQRNEPCLTPEQRAEIQAQLQHQLMNLQKAGILPEKYAKRRAELLWPVAAAPEFDDYGFYAVVNFVDQEPAYPNHLLDYHCGNRTYDLSSGYNHQGVDIINWPFGWHKMSQNQVMAVAAAPGIIIHKQDGFFDRNCSFGSGYWNAVYIQHDDGAVAWYGHLKKNTLTEKSIG